MLENLTHSTNNITIMSNIIDTVNTNENIISGIVCLIIILCLFACYIYGQCDDDVEIWEMDEKGRWIRRR